MKTLTLVSAGLELPDRGTLLKLEQADEYPRVSLFYEALNSDRLDERYLQQSSRFRRQLYRTLPEMGRYLSEAMVVRKRYDALISWTERLGLPLAFFLGLAKSRTPHIAIFSWISVKKKANFLRRVHKDIDRIILMSSSQRDIAIHRLGLPPSKISLLKWGIDQKFWRPIDTQADMICSAGAEMRDYPTLIEAMRGQSFSCHIAAGTQRNVIHPAVTAIWRSGSLPQNITAGRKNYVDLRMLYAQSRFVVIPTLHSDTDHGATSILEAMAMGRAVIGTRTEGQVDVIQEGRTGLLVPPCDPAALRQAIRYLWDNPDIAERMGVEGRRHVERHHTLESWVGDVKAIIDDVIEQKRGLLKERQERAFYPLGTVGKGASCSVTTRDVPPLTLERTKIRRRKILMMFHFCPNPPPRNLGPAKRTYPLLMEALKRHDVSVLTFGSPQEEAMFREQMHGLCKHIVFINNARPRYVNFFRRAFVLLRGKSMFYTLYSRKMQRALDELTGKEQFEIIHCATTLLGFYRFPAGIPLVGDTHNVEYDLLYRTFLESKNGIGRAICYLEYRLGKPQEINNCRKFDAIITTTERDRAVLQRDIPHQRITVIQNGVDPDFFEPIDIHEEPNTVVFTGLMSYFPNDHGIHYFLDQVFPLVRAHVPSARLYVVGKNPSRSLLARSSDNIIVTGFVEDVRPYIARSQVFIIPLLIGGGIRGKALEAMAMKKAIVSTTVGCEGINLKNGQSVLVAGSPGAFADSVVRLFKDADLRTRLATNAHRTVLEEYNWEEKGRQLEAVHSVLLGNRLTLPIAER